MPGSRTAVETLRPDPANPRRISEAELEALTRSLRQFGFVQPVLARSRGRVHALPEPVREGRQGRSRHGM